MAAPEAAAANAAVRAASAAHYLPQTPPSLPGGLEDGGSLPSTASSQSGALRLGVAAPPVLGPAEPASFVQFQMMPGSLALPGVVESEQEDDSRRGSAASTGGGAKLGLPQGKAAVTVVHRASSDDGGSSEAMDAFGEQEEESEGGHGGDQGIKEGSSASEEEESEQSDRWPPKRPLARFKTRVQFSQRFRPHKQVRQVEELTNPDLRERVKESRTVEIKDMCIGWLNQRFGMDIRTEFQFEIGFPIIVLTVLDAIYLKRIRWREVDWRFQYKRALEKNYALAENIWLEVNMEKAREFRPENTHLRMENMSASTMKDKLDFVRLLKRWYDVRNHHAAPYDPMDRRREVVKQCLAWGHTVKFPSWIKFEKEEPPKEPRDPAKAAYDRMPEFKRLIWFLGSPEHQTM